MLPPIVVENHRGLKNGMCKFIYSMYYYVVYDSAEHYRDLKNDVYMFIYQKLPPVWSACTGMVLYVVVCVLSW